MNDTSPIQNADDPTPHDPRVAPTPPPSRAVTPAAEAAPGPATTWSGGLRHRVLGLRAVAAVALASLVLGGLGGAALGAVSDGGSGGSGGSGGNGGPGGGPGGGFGRPGTTQNGQLPGRTGQLGQPGGTQQQDDVQPDASGDTTSSDTT